MRKPYKMEGSDAPRAIILPAELLRLIVKEHWVQHMLAENKNLKEHGRQSRIQLKIAQHDHLYYKHLRDRDIDHIYCIDCGTNVSRCWTLDGDDFGACLVGDHAGRPKNCFDEWYRNEWALALNHPHADYYRAYCDKCYASLVSPKKNGHRFPVG